MIIVLDKTESLEMVEDFLRTVCNGESTVDIQSLMWQTDLDHEDMKYKIDVYVR